jgi:histidyl-tRNA synthetase
MKISAVKGTRDFYPPQMAVRNFIVDGWKAASRRSGFEEFDGPIFEHLTMYQVKSGEEIVEQLFHLTDRGGRELAIRPEMTPTLARMVNQQINALPRPIKWFSVPRLCRAERPQKGRLREFFQWNLDIIGVEDVLADAEVIFCAVDYLRSAGLTEKDIVVKISSRRMLASFLKSIGIPEEKLLAIYALLDKKQKLPPEAFDELLNKEVPDRAVSDKIRRFMDQKGTINQKVVYDAWANDPAMSESVGEMEKLIPYLYKMGIERYCTFDPGIIRGLAYYTGIVFEIHDRTGQLRALCGGGRYDNLLSDFGGPKVTATGMGMGDCVLEILLREKGLLTDEQLKTRSLDYYIAVADGRFANEAIKLAAKIRLAGKSCDFSYKGGNLGKQFKQADAANAAQTIILGSEYQLELLVVKDMKTGEQSQISIEAFEKALSET